MSHDEIVPRRPCTKCGRPAVTIKEWTDSVGGPAGGGSWVDKERDTHEDEIDMMSQGPVDADCPRVS
ncbi:MAG: hypothetical protein INR62_09045 [Rhodospirillales bacterium]|nr:hypothetical protein [Acetobacter sp.]